MKKILLFVLVLIVGCATDTHESSIKEMISAFDEMTAIIEGVTDESSADAAIGKLEIISKKMGNIKTRLEQLGDPDETTKKDIAEYESKMKEALGRLMKVSMGINFKPYGKKVMKAMGDAMQK